MLLLRKNIRFQLPHWSESTPRANLIQSHPTERIIRWMNTVYTNRYTVARVEGEAGKRGLLKMQFFFSDGDDVKSVELERTSVFFSDRPLRHSLLFNAVLLSPTLAFSVVYRVRYGGAKVFVGARAVYSISAIVLFSMPFFLARH